MQTSWIVLKQLFCVLLGSYMNALVEEFPFREALVKKERILREYFRCQDFSYPLPETRDLISFLIITVRIR